MRRFEQPEGSVIVTVLFAAVVLGALVYATTLIARTELSDSRRDLDKVRTLALAESGAEMGIEKIRVAIDRTRYVDPMFGIRSLFQWTASGGYKSYKPFVALPIQDSGKKTGSVTVSMTAKERANGLDITILSTGYYPAAPQSLPPGSVAPKSTSIRAIIRVETKTSRAFDYGYYLDNRAWFAGPSMTINGNLFTIGRFDGGGSAMTIDGQATYDSLSWPGGNAALSGYRDLNNDGVFNGDEGTIFSAWDIVGAGSILGNGGQPANQHQFQEPLRMPNLANLSVYEPIATSSGGSISVGGTVYSNAILGDDELTNNLWVVGTAADPIEVTGTVVIRGTLVISGVVSGRGAIYVGGNIHIPNDLTYLNGPATARPTDKTKATTEAWLTANRDKDLLGLFARENIVLGDHTDVNWRSPITNWLGSAKCVSGEDRGVDGIPGNKIGMDNVASTADDDLLEGDNLHLVEFYSFDDMAEGMIPPGFGPGDPIPGSGEDLDGDAVADPPLSITMFDLPGPLGPSLWIYNSASAPGSYSDVSSMTMSHVDGLLFANHAVVGVSTSGSPYIINGGIWSRNEAIVNGGGGLTVNYDCRLLGGDTSVAAEKFKLPQRVAPIRTLSWSILEFDPNHSN